jgi:hypothetical protein
LPGGSDLRVAIRRMLRVGANAGNVLEDLGIVPDYVHRLTRDDVLHGNVDLLAEAARILSSQKTHSMRATIESREGSHLLRVETRNLEWINILIEGRPRRSFEVKDGEISIPLADITRDPINQGSRIDIQGFQGDRLVAATRKTL